MNPTTQEMIEILGGQLLKYIYIYIHKVIKAFETDLRGDPDVKIIGSDISQVICRISLYD